MTPTVTIRMLGPDDASVLDRVAPDVFNDDVDPRWTAEFFGDTRHHLAVALDGELWFGRGRFDALSSLVRSASSPPHAWADVRYLVFELPGGGGSFAERATKLVELARAHDGQRVLVIGHVATRFGLDHFSCGLPLATLVEAPFRWREGWEYTVHERGGAEREP